MYAAVIAENGFRVQRLLRRFIAQLHLYYAINVQTNSNRKSAGINRSWQRRTLGKTK